MICWCTFLLWLSLIIEGAPFSRVVSFDLCKSCLVLKGCSLICEKFYSGCNFIKQFKMSPKCHLMTFDDIYLTECWLLMVTYANSLDLDKV